MTGALVVLGVLAAAWLLSDSAPSSTPGGGASGAGGGGGPAPSPVEILRRGAAVWVLADAKRLGVVLGGPPPRGLAVACGPMFDGVGPRFALLDAARGVALETRARGLGSVVSVVDGVATLAPGGAPLPGAAVAVQGYPTMVVGGRASPVQSGDRTRRVALAVMRGNRRVALVSFTGTNTDFTRELVEGGAVEAVYLDGGRAAYLAAEGVVLVDYQTPERSASWLVVT